MKALQTAHHELLDVRVVRLAAGLGSRRRPRQGLPPPLLAARQVPLLLLLGVRPLLRQHALAQGRTGVGLFVNHGTTPGHAERIVGIQGNSYGMYGHAHTSHLLRRHGRRLTGCVLAPAVLRPPLLLLHHCSQSSIGVL